MTDDVRKALGQLSDDEWKHLILTLGNYALMCCKSRFWRTDSATELPRGETYDSLVSLALEGVYAGLRRWDPHRQPNLQGYLMDVIDSKISQMVRSHDNRRLTRLSDTTEFTQIVHSPEALFLAQEARQHAECVLQRIIQATSSDPQVSQIIQALQDGYEPRQIRQVTGLSERDFRNAVRRLRRAAANATDINQQKDTIYAEAKTHLRQYGNSPSHRQIKQRSRMDDGGIAGVPPGRGCQSRPTHQWGTTPS